MQDDKVASINRYRSRDKHNHPPAVGHEKLLASMIANGDLVVVGMGDQVTTGVVTHFDKWTITFQVAEFDELIVMFKHSMDWLRKLTAQELNSLEQSDPKGLLDLQGRW